MRERCRFFSLVRGVGYARGPCLPAHVWCGRTAIFLDSRAIDVVKTSDGISNQRC